MRDRNYKLYIHIFPNKKVYIGITQQTLKNRWKNGYGYKKNSRVYNAIMKYGWDNIEHKLMYDDLTIEEAIELEIQYIMLYKSNNREYGYNIANGGNYKGKHSEETKKKISLKNSGVNNPMWDNHKKHKKFTEEGKKNCSISHLGIKLSEEAKAKISKKVLCIETNIVYKSIAEAERQLNCYDISKCCRHVAGHVTSGGYHWRYYEDN